MFSAFTNREVIHRSEKNFKLTFRNVVTPTKDCSPKRQFKNFFHNGVELIYL